MANINFVNYPVVYQDVGGLSKFANGKGSIVIAVPPEKLDTAKARGWNVRTGKNKDDCTLTLKFPLETPPDREPLKLDVMELETGEVTTYTPAQLAGEIRHGLRLKDCDVNAREYHWEYMGKKGVSLYVNHARFTATRVVVEDEDF